MKKTNLKTGENKNVPETDKAKTRINVKKKDCEGCHEPETFHNKGSETVRKDGKFLIVKREPTANEDEWEVTFEKWFDCYCTKQTKTATIQMNNGRFPTSKTLISHGY